MQDYNFINIETLNKYQRFLYGHDDLFKKLSNLFEKKKLPNFKNPLLISDSPFTSFYNIKFSDDSIAFNIKDDDIQNLILQGFRDISIYMKQFEIIEEVSVS